MAATRRPRKKAASESGYAMLLVFLMAAVIAIALYRELPRVAFEAQRSKEQLLIERGEQYKRAIQVFVRKFSRYPATIEELENTNNIRFLRKRYLDPMTGKDKWRLIHINGGVLTDSIIQQKKPGQDKEPQANANTFIGEGPVMGAANDANQGQANPALRRRASDDRPAMTAEAPEPPQPDAGQDVDINDLNEPVNNEPNEDNGEETPATGAPGTAPNANVPGRLPFQPGMYPPGTAPPQTGMVNPAMANQPYGARYAPGTLPNQAANPGTAGGFPQPAYPGQGSDTSSSSGVYAAPYLGETPSVSPAPGLMPAAQGQQPGIAYPNQPQQGFPGQQPGIAYPNQPQQGFPGQQATPFGQPAAGGMAVGGSFGGSNFAGAGGAAPAGNFPGGAAPASGITMNQLGLGGPRPGGLQGVPGMGGQQMGGGIAGVASESKGPAIKVYNERKKYNEWEFVYDQSKDRGLAGVQGGGGAPGTPAQQMGNMPPGMNPQQPGMSGFSQPGTAGFGQSGFAGQSPGFGQQQPQPQPQQPPN